jgi:hypothetical protein
VKKEKNKDTMSRMNEHQQPQPTHDEAEDKLVEVPQYSLIKLRNMFKVSWPKHIIAYSLLENYMEWLEKVNNIKNLKILCLNGEWRKDGTFVIIVSDF